MGSGNDLYTTANDGGRFVFQPMAGDCEVIARVKWPTGANLNYNARAGVMIRQQNNRSSAHMIFCRMRGDDASNVGRISASGRQTPTSSITSYSQNGYTNEWMLLRLIRQGDTVRAFFSTNAAQTVWLYYSAQSVPMGEAANAGIFVSRNSASAAQLMTNDFDQVAARQLVNVQTNATAGLDLSWVSELPDLSNGWSYAYTVTRAPTNGVAETLAQGLTATTYSDATAAVGTWYRYAVTAVPVPQDGLTSPPNVLLGTSAAVRLPYASTNLATGLQQGFYAAYYSPTSSLVAGAGRIESSVTNVMSSLPVGSTNYFGTIFNANLQVDASDLYTFFIEADDGLRLWVGDTLAIDSWVGGNYKSSSSPVWLEAGRSYPVRVAYYQDTGGRVCTLAWRRVGAPGVRVDVPKTAFSPVALPWRHEDIGDVKNNGNADFGLCTGAVTVVASGNALTNSADACHLISRDATGDFDLVVRLDSLTGPGADRRAGLVARSDLTPGASGVSLLAVPGASAYSVAIVRRDAAGGVPAVASLVTSVATSDKLWLRLSCKGQVISTAYRADAAATWTPIATQAVNFSTACKIGLAASSADAGGSVQAAFGGLSGEVYPRLSLTPSDDVYVRSDKLNYGTATELLLKRAASDTQREVFLRFNVAGLAAVRSAALRLYVQGRDATPAVQETVVRWFTDLNWKETAVSWTNAPGGLWMPTVFLAADDPTIVARTNTPAVGQYLELDVTKAVLAAAAGSGDLTLNLYTTVPTSGSISFASKEHATAAFRPSLVFTLDAPTRVTADGGPDTGNVTIAWSAYTGAAFYRVYRATTAEGAYAAVGGAVTNLLFKNTGLTAGQRYYYRVSAVTDDGETELSSVVSAVAPASSTTAIVSGDAFVEGSGGTRQSANSNYGSQPLLTIKYNATALEHFN